MTFARIIAFLVLPLLLVAGCNSRGDNAEPQSSAPTTPSVGGDGPVTIGQGPCSLVVVIQGNPTLIRADRGSSVSTGGITIVFGPDCSSEVTTKGPGVG